jgi:NNP family nitrate/nitrite transporter-like MFS transporter
LTPEPTEGQRQRVLCLSTTAFTLMFAVWLMLGMLGIPISKELGLTDIQLYWLTIAAILSGSLARFHFGVWTDRYGGRVMFTLLLLLTVVPTYLVSRVTYFEELLACAVLYGAAGNSFSVGIAWNAAWFPKGRQGTALGVFGAGNVGASVTKLVGPLLIAAVPAAGFLGGAVPGGWRFIPIAYAGLLVLMAAAVWLLAPAPDRCPAKGRPFAEMLAPVRSARVWEFSLHYVVVFGAYVALSGVLPKYYYTNYGAELASGLGLTALTPAEFDAVKGLTGDAYRARLAANPAVAADLKTLTMWIGWLAGVCYVFPASLLRPVGGWLSDRFGAAAVMGAVLAAMLAAGVLLTAPLGLGVWAFTAALFVLGAGMGVGKASVYKMIPEHFPREVGAVGGLVGLLGALGGVLLPLAWVPLQSATGLPQVVFGALLALTAVSAGWFAVGQRRTRPAPSPTTFAAVTLSGVSPTTR